jgi:hypothetical protein
LQIKLKITADKNIILLKVMKISQIQPYQFENVIFWLVVELAYLEKKYGTGTGI